ncbi:MAG: oligosaccharide flippase family protein, partial [Pseudomonadota bacterium]
MAVSGLARVLSVVLLTLRAKVVAMLLGPEGIGLLGLFTALQEMGAQTADGGLAHSTVRNIARARERRRRLARLLQAMRSAVLVLGLAAALLIWCAREPIAQMILGSEDNALAVGILGVGVALTMVYRAQQAVLSGFRQVRDLAILTASATALATAGGVGAIAILGLDGIIWAVLAGPIAGVAVASIFVARL